MQKPNVKMQDNYVKKVFFLILHVKVEWDTLSYLQG